MSRGGRRPGGGRKPLPPEQRRIVLSCRVKPETFDAICREAGQESIGRLLDKIFNSEIPNDHPLPEDTVLFNKVVAEGKRLMMEEAVEAEMQPFGMYNTIIFGRLCANREKVKIIIIKED